MTAKKFVPFLKKFKFINELVFESYVQINEQLIHLIIKYCNPLKKLIINECDFNGFNEKPLQEFGEKLLKSLKFLDITCFHSRVREPNALLFETLCNCIPNVVSLRLNGLSFITTKSNNYYSLKIIANK